MDSPKISVIMSVLNGERYLREAIDSILGQTFGDFEFLIVDDGSTDGTREILRSYADPRVIPIVNEANIGIPRSVNKALGQARGEYIARMDADDICDPRRFEMEVKFLDAHGEIGAVGSNVWFVDSEGRKIERSNYPRSPARIRWCLSFFNPMAQSSMMIRRTALDRVGGYDVKYRYSQDYALWCSLARVTDLQNLDEALVLHRFHSKRVSKNFSGDQYMYAVDVIGRYCTGVIGEEVSPEQVMRILESRQGEDDRLPDIIYRLYKASMSDRSMTPGDERYIRRDAARKILYRYDLLKNPGRRRTIRHSFEASAINGTIMIAYDAAYLVSGMLKRGRPRPSGNL